MRALTTYILCVLLGANAGWMLLAPESWYRSIPGVAESGPLNIHFVRDVALAYFVVAGGLLWSSVNPAAWPAAFAGAMFLTLHALLHAAEYVTDHADTSRLVWDAVLIFAPSVIAIRISVRGGLLGPFLGTRT